MRRRSLLQAAGTVGLVGLAGCGGFRLQSANRAPPLVENRPSAVYFPTHVEGMAMIDTTQSGDFGIGLTYSYPHRFWTTTGTKTEAVTIRTEDSIHLMATIWDADTGMVLPVGAGLTIEVTREDETVLERAPWPMISPVMGFHYGDNIALPAEGQYSITVRVGAVTARRFGPFADRFSEPVEVSIPFEFSRSRRDDLDYRTFDEKAGTRGAPQLMDMEMLPTSQLPTSDQLPGRVVGETTTGDATFVATEVATESGPYLALSPRTPFNRIPLPLMSLAATVDRDDGVVFDGPLNSAIHPDIGYHYGTAIDGVESGDRIDISIQAPPQVSRHEGYETAFLEMAPTTITVP